MNKLITLFCLLACFSLDAQRYTFTESDGIYSPLVDADTVLYETWYDSEYELTLPFDLMLYGKEWGQVSFSQGAITLESVNMSDTIAVISGWFCDIMSSEVGFEESPILTQTTGNMGERIFKIEWRQAYFFVLDGFFDFVNFQIWIYEADRTVEMHYGPSVTDLAEFAFDERNQVFGGNVGVGFGEEEAINATFLGGSIDNITVVDSIELLRGFPTNGTIYTFEEISTSIKDLFSEVNIYPTLATDAVYIENTLVDKHIPFQVVDLSGHVVISDVLINDITSVGIMSLVPGEYFVQNQNGQYMGRFTKQ